MKKYPTSKQRNELVFEKDDGVLEGETSKPFSGLDQKHIIIFSIFLPSPSAVL